MNPRGREPFSEAAGRVLVELCRKLGPLHAQSSVVQDRAARKVCLGQIDHLAWRIAT
jgi:hypothetical protein